MARSISLERISILFRLAGEEERAGRLDRSDRYVQMAKSISTRRRIRMPGHLKRMYCKQCGGYLAPSLTRVRLRQGWLTVTCLRCGRQMRYGYGVDKSPSSRA